MNTKLIAFVVIGLALIGFTAWKFTVFNAQEEELPSPTNIQAPGKEPSTTSPTASPPNDEIQESVQKLVN